MSDPESALDDMDVSIEKELDTILPGNDPLDNLKAIHEGGLEYSVLSVRNGSPTYHYVKLGSEPSCTCGDYEYNRDEREICAHIAKAILADQMEPDRLAVRELINVTATVTEAASKAREAATEARSTARELDTGLAKVRDTQAGQAASTASDTTENQGETDTSGSGSVPEQDQIGDITERLQDAYDNVLDDMQVQHHNGKVWVQTGKDTPDTLPGPGNVEVFDALLKNPDQTVYAPDDDSPGEWWKNYIEPEYVEEYISEVLE